MKSKAHGKKCQAMGVSESSVDEPESEETGTGRRGRDASRHGGAVLARSWMDCLRNIVAVRC